MIRLSLTVMQSLIIQIFLLSSEALYTTRSMDGVIWEQPDAFYTVDALAPGLPHLCDAMIAFFEGALDTWLRYVSLASTNQMA